MKPALLVIDVQKAFFGQGEETPRSLHEAIEYINAAIVLFREHGLPVISVQQLDEAEKLLPGQEGFDLPDELQVQPQDLHIHKRYSNGFNKTPLLAHLLKLGVDTVILCGYCAEYCVTATYYGAEDVDLKPILLRGGLASGSKERVQHVEAMGDLISYGALKRVLG